jgi:translation elongation factor EF-Tu-like GTPase
MFRLTVQDVFLIKGRGLVATGRVELGEIRVGDEVRINGSRSVHVDAIEQFRKKVDVAVTGDNVGLLFSRLDRSDLGPGAVLTTGAAEPASGGVEVTL